MPTLPSDLGGRALPTPSRQIVQPTQINYAGASDALAMNNRANQEAAAGAIDAVAEREKQVKKDAILMASDRENQAKKKVLDLLYGNDTTPGLYSRQGKAALGVSDEYEKQFQSIRDSALQGIDDKDAQQALKDSLESMNLSNLSGVKSHEMKERTGFSTEVAASKADLANQRVGLDWQNDKTFEKSLAEAEDSALTVSKLQGLSAEGTTEKILQARSSLFRSRIGAMIGQDKPEMIMQANLLYKKAIDEGNMTLADVQDLDRTFNAILPKAQAHAEFTKFNSGLNIDAMDASQIIPAIMHVESRGRDYNADGSVVTSATGAKGKMQVLDSTNRDPGYGVVPAKDDSLAERARVGQDYFMALQKHYGNNQLALLAYNWGPGNVDKHIDEVGDPRKVGNTSMDYFMATVPSAEARAYVPSVMAAAGYGTGKVDLDKANAYAANLKPEVGKEFVALAEQQNKAVAGQQKISAIAATDSVFKFLNAAQGNGWQNMPADLRVTAVQNGIADKVQSYTGQTMPEMANYLYSLSPKELQDVDLNDPSIRFSLSPQDQARWTKRKEQLNDQSFLVTDTVRKGLVDKAFAKRGININDQSKKTGPAMMAQKNRFNELLDTYVDGYAAANNGKYPNPAEMQALIDNLFIKRTYEDAYTWFDKDVAPYEVTIDTIPKSEREQVKQDLLKRGLPTSDAMIIRTWTAQLKESDKG